MLKNRFHSLFLRFVVDESAAQGGGGDDDGENGSPAGDLGFPANTPTKDMTPDQQAAYWKDKARKHEKNRAPSNLAELIAAKAELDRIQTENLTPDEKALNEATSKGRREGAATLLHDAVRSSLQAQRPHMTTEELDEFLEDVALDKFLGQDGRLDTKRVERLAGKLAAAPAPDGATPPAADPGPIGGQALGFVLGATTPPPSGNAGSVEDHRQREASRYAHTITK